MSETTRCPKCGGELHRVFNEGGYLNDDQFASVRAGDWYCETCTGTRSRTGYRYFWNRELVTVEPQHNAD